jgi:hypothetical protein
MGFAWRQFISGLAAHLFNSRDVQYDQLLERLKYAQL